MKSFSKVTALTLAAGMALSAAPVTVFAEGEEVYKGCTNTFSYYSMGEKESNFFYSDEYFKDSGKEKNEHLRTMSLALALSLYGTQKDTAADLLKNIGCDTETIRFDDMDTTGDDTIGSVIAKSVAYFSEDESAKIIAVSLRGNQYFDEWASNLDSGVSGDAKGVAESADKVIARLKAYEEENDCKGYKIWIAGYSRGGSVTDLVGKYINEHLDEFGITADDLYAYTFEAPRASSTDTNYENIHDVLNPNDIIPLVYPEEWGLYRTGVDEYLNAEDAYVQPMTLALATFKPVIAERYNSEGETIGYADPVPMKEYNAKLVSFLANGVTREQYAAMSGQLGQLAADFISADPAKQAAIKQYFKTVLKSVDTAALHPYVAALMMSEKDSTQYNLTMAKIALYLKTLCDATDHSACFTDVEYAKVMAAMPSLLTAGMPLLLADYNNEGECLEITGTALGNYKNIIAQHYPELVLKLVQAEDSYYTDGVTVRKGDVYDFVGTELAPEECTDEKLKAMGFDDNDIELRNKGYDLWLGYDNSIESIDAFKTAYGSSADFIDKYYEENFPDRDFEYATIIGLSLAAVKGAGYVEPVRIDVKDTPAAFSLSMEAFEGLPYSDDVQGVVDNYRFKCLYFEMGDKSCTPIDITASVLDNESIRLDINYCGEGVYVFYYEYDKSTDSEPDSQPDSEPDSEPDSQPDSEPDSQPDSEPDSKPDSNPDSDPEDLYDEIKPVGVPVPGTPYVNAGLSDGKVPTRYKASDRDYYKWVLNTLENPPSGPSTAAKSETTTSNTTTATTTTAGGSEGASTDATANPGTGAGAVSAVMVTLAAAALVVGKRKK